MQPPLSLESVPLPAQRTHNPCLPPPLRPLQDDLAYAAAWLYRATGEEAFLTAARSYLQRAQYSRNYFVSWDAVFVPTDVLLLGLGVGPSPGVDHEYQVGEFVKTWTKGEGRGEGGGVTACSALLCCTTLEASVV